LGVRGCTYQPIEIGQPPGCVVAVLNFCTGGILGGGAQSPGVVLVGKLPGAKAWGGGGIDLGE